MSAGAQAQGGGGRGTAWPGWEPVIGLEMHTRLLTRSKLFSGAPASYGADPNTQACAVDLGLPGVLPVLNREAVRMAVRFGLAVGGRIAPRCIFARKNYFYPDLPKGYQISQYEEPIVEGGTIAVELADGGAHRVELVRAHLEEDAGRSVHEGVGSGATGIDLNRAGTALIEIVTAPVLHGPAEAAACMRAVHTLVRWLAICDGNMEEGSFRCDANVSVRPAGAQALGVRTEIKNVNSFRFVERALEYEIERQVDLLEAGAEVVQETRLYDPERHETRPMRLKEEADDYRYFPDPDLLPVVLDEAFVDEVRAALPELPEARRARLARDYGLAAAEAAQLVSSRETADYFEAAAGAAGAAGASGGADGAPDTARLAANWVIGELAGALNREGLDVAAAPVGPERLGRLVGRIADGTVSGRMAKTVFEAMWRSGDEADAIIEAQGLRQVTDSGEIERLVDEVLDAHPDQAGQYLGGAEKVLGFLVGQVMKRSGGKADPRRANETLKARLEARRRE